MGSVFFVVGPVRGENLVGLAAEQEVEFLLEDAVELFAELSIEIGHLPATELEALGRILGRPAGRLHDTIDGDHGADDNLPHGSLSLFEPSQLPCGALEPEEELEAEEADCAPAAAARDRVAEAGDGEVVER